jgi:hypothetical protein
MSFFQESEVVPRMDWNVLEIKLKSRERASGSKLAYV